MYTPSSAIGNGRGMTGGQSTEQMKEDEQFPLLFESSSFYYSSPIVHDIEGDGVADAILGDYDGNLHFVGLDFEHQDTQQQQSGSTNQRRKRYYKRISIPRLYVRKAWYEVAINRTKEDETMAEVDESEAAKKNHTKWEEFEPYHTYFAGQTDTDWRGPHDGEALRGVSGDILNMDVEMARKMTESKRRMKQTSLEKKGGDEEANGNENEGSTAATHRRLQEVVNQSQDKEDAIADVDASVGKESEEATTYTGDDYGYMYEQEPELFGDDSIDAPLDGSTVDQDATTGNQGDAHRGEEMNEEGDGFENEGMDDYYYRRRYGGYGDDMYQPEAPDGYDSYEQYQEIQSKYYHDSNYLRLPPHLLSTCTLAELPRPYSGANANPIDRVDELLLCSVSYYFDEDECKDPTKKSGKSFGKHANIDGGDETEEQRGRYLANAILGYNLRWKYWSVQEVLDLSTDWSAPLGDIAQGGTAHLTSETYTGAGALALATPLVVNLDGGDRNHILVGTSMVSKCHVTNLFLFLWYSDNLLRFNL